jgi:uncharacterized protein YbjT (DUF2867 family)
VTGALGNVGCNTPGALLEEGHEVVEPRKAASKMTSAHLVQSDAASLGAALEGVDAVVHLAAILPPNVTRRLAGPVRERRRDPQPDRVDGGVAEGEPDGLRVVTGVAGDVQTEPPFARRRRSPD